MISYVESKKTKSHDKTDSDTENKLVAGSQEGREWGGARLREEIKRNNCRVYKR